MKKFSYWKLIINVLNRIGPGTALALVVTGASNFWLVVLLGLMTANGLIQLAITDDDGDGQVDILQKK